jgi:hypothetical protein
VFERKSGNTEKIPGDLEQRSLGFAASPGVYFPMNGAKVTKWLFAAARDVPGPQVRPRRFRACMLRRGLTSPRQRIACIAN